MKNALLSGLIIGLLSGLWLLIMRWAGYSTFNDQVSPIEYISVIIPVLGVFLGLKSYRDHNLGGKLGFLEGIIQSFKIILFGGIIAGFIGVIYINYIDANNFRDFSGRLFGALLIGVLSCFASTLLLMNTSKKID